MKELDHLCSASLVFMHSHLSLGQHSTLFRGPIINLPADSPVNGLLHRLTGFSGGLAPHQLCGFPDCGCSHRKQGQLGRGAGLGYDVQLPSVHKHLVCGNKQGQTRGREGFHGGAEVKS